MATFSFTPYLRDIAPLKEPTDVDVLQYAAGLCDTDGSFQVQVHVTTKKTTPSVTISQAVGGYKSIEYMYDMFGGSIIKHPTPAMDTNQPSLMWYLCNAEDVTRFCAMLLPHLTVKAREAKVLMTYPLGNLHAVGVRATNMKTGETRDFPTLKECQQSAGTSRIQVKDGAYDHKDWRYEEALSQDDKKAIHARREEIANELKRLHHVPDDPIPADVTRRPAYFAGVADGDVTFDTEPRTKSSQTHSMQNKYRVLPDFMQRTYRGTVRYEQAKDRFHWEVGQRIDAADFLNAVAPYLQGKRAQAELILRMPPGGAAVVHCLLRDLKGKHTSPTPWIDKVRGLLNAIQAAPNNDEVLTLMSHAAAPAVEGPAIDNGGGGSGSGCSANPASDGPSAAGLASLVDALGNHHGFKHPPKELPPGVRQDRKSKLYFASMDIRGKPMRILPDYQTIAEAAARYAEVKRMRDDDERYKLTQTYALDQAAGERERLAKAVRAGDVKLPTRVYLTASDTYQAKVLRKGKHMAIGTYKTISEAVAAQEVWYGEHQAHTN